MIRETRQPRRGASDERARRAVALAEYSAIKGEQTARIGFRDNLIYATFVAIAGTLAAAHSGNRDYLLLVPFATWVLGWTYLANDQMISAIGRYFRAHPMLSGLGWESEHPDDAHRAARKRMQLAVDLTAFCVSGLAALVCYWTAPAPSPLLLGVSGAELLALVVLAWQIITYAELGARHGTEGEQ